MGIKRYHFLSQVPQPYRGIFQTGQVPSSSTLRIYHPHTQRVLLGIVSLLTFPIFIGLLVFFFYGVGRIFRQLNEEQSVGLAFLTAIGTLLLLSVILCAVAMYLTLFRDFAIAKNKPLNRFHFGLLLDDHFLVWRRKVPFLPIVIIQKSDIESVELIRRRRAVSEGVALPYVRITVRHPDGRRHLDILNNSYDFSGKGTMEVLNEWRGNNFE